MSEPAADFLIEVGVEELPASYIDPALQHMRKTLTDLFADKEFLAECKKQGLDCSSPLTGQQMADFVEKIYKTPKSARDKIAEIYMLGQSK